MPQPPLDVSILRITGYADVLTESVLPSIVAPVFQSKADPDRIWVPPYSFSDQYLCNATEIDWRELLSLRDRIEVTLLDTPFEARRGWEMWVDQRGEVKYQPRTQARKELDQIAGAARERARETFSKGKLEEAQRHSSVAILANERDMPALAIKLAIARITGKTSTETILWESAEPVAIPGLKLLVEELLRENRRPSGVSAAPPKPPMRDSATIPSRMWA